VTLAESLATAVADGLARGASFDDLVALLIESRDAGLDQQAAYDAITTLRSTTDEALDDRVLELLDLVSGWCRPSARIWPEPMRFAPS
jgi:hypothetical protein